MTSAQAMQFTFDAAINALGMSGQDLPNLTRSVGLSSERIGFARAHLEDALRDEDPTVDVVAFGSMARYEMTLESDFDYLVVSLGLDQKAGASRRVARVADGLRQSMAGHGGPEVKKPGQSGLFGSVVAASDLVDIIGLEQDTNHSHSRRILLLEESVSLYRPDGHARLIRAILNHYLEATLVSSSGVPRFLMNDLIRYWRTISVDYQAKSPAESPYSLRYLKLIISRKFTYASSIAPLLAMELPSDDSMDAEAVLFNEFAKPAIVRFADFGERIGASSSLQSEFRNVFKCVDEFNGWLGSEDWRAQIAEECSGSDPKRLGTKFSNAIELGKGMQISLEKIFFEGPLQQASQKYLAF